MFLSITIENKLGKRAYSSTCATILADLQPESNAAVARMKTG